MDPAKSGGDWRPSLIAILDQARELGFLGPAAVERHIEHALGFSQARASVFPVSAIEAHVAEEAPGVAVDLGSGGGIPGLVLAAIWAETQVVLVEVGERRASFLEASVRRLGFEDRVAVVQDRAELVGRSQYRGSADVVVARSFGPPSVTAECAAPLLRLSGVLVVSEPPEAQPSGVEAPGAQDRWPAEPLAMLGLVRRRKVVLEYGYMVLEQRTLCPERYPRRVGVPSKRPLF